MRSSAVTAAFAGIECLESRLLLARTPGIDVSHWQGSINWSSVFASGKKFVFQKATEGIDFQDSSLNSNVPAAKNAGLLVGVYHFCHPDTNSATAEANWFVSRAGNYMKAGYLPPVLDLEDGASLTASALTTWANTFCTTVRSLTGVTPIIYCNTNYATNEVTSSINQWPLWIANWSTAYGDPMTTGSPPCGVWGAGNWDFWQHSSTGAVSGISGNVDLDVFNGDLTQLNSWVITNPTAAVLQGATPIPDGQTTPVDFGNVQQGQPGPSITFTVRNNGGSLMTMSGLAVPGGYTITEGLAASLLPAQSDTFTVRLDSTTVGTKSGQISFATNDPLRNPYNFAVTGTVLPEDLIPPTVESSEFVYTTSPHTLQFQFSEDVSGSLQTSDLTVRDINTQATILVSDVSWDAGTRVATFTLNNVVPDGSYRATLSGSGVTDPSGNPLGADHTYDFFFLSGDADHDGRVNLVDFNIVAANFGQSPRDFTQGDFNYDTVVNLSDFNILASNFGMAVAAPGSTAWFGIAGSRHAADLSAQDALDSLIA